MTDVPTLSRALVDRAAQLRDDPDRLDSAWSAGRLLVVDADGRATIDESGDSPALHLVEAQQWAGDGTRLFLGVGPDGTSFWAAVGTPVRALGARPLNLREVGARLSALDAGLLVTAVALANWHRTHTHCPRCGAPTRVTQAGWSRRCDVDDSTHFPRTDPAVIVLLHDGGDRALLGRQPTWPTGRYSTIAGFVESGESSEQAVRREVLEETGTVVDEVVYRGSQPWPFPASLMLGYEALVVSGEATTADDELEDVRWFTREEIRTGAVGLPPPTSIAHWLITSWLDRG